jgi:hypothetical protein
MTIFLIGIPFLIYGYLCRLLNIYFFWDSKHFGWILIATGLMGFLIDQRKARLAQRRNIFWVRIGIGIIIFSFAIAGSAVIMIKSSYSYQDTIEQIKINNQMKNEIGDVRGFGLIPSGPGIISLVYGTKPGTSTLIVTVRGEKGHRDIEIKLNRPLK